MKSLIALCLLCVTGLLLSKGAHAQAQLVYCDVSIAAYCTPTTNPGAGTQGDLAWQAFGKVNNNFLFLDPLWAIPPGEYICNPTGTTGGLGYCTGGGGGGGGVFVVSVVSTNGFAGTVATATSTPAITMETTITGVLKGNGTAISAAAAADIYGPFGCSGVATTFLNGAGGCTTPAGGGNVSNSGTPAQYQIPAWASSTGLIGIGPGTAGQLLVSGGASAYPSYSSTPTIVGTNFTGTASALSIGGNAATATAFATSPAQCSGAALANGITASGVANCLGGQIAISTSTLLTSTAAMAQVYDSATGATTITIPANSSVAYPVATCIQFYNDPAGGVITIAINTDTMTLSPPVGGSPTGSRSLAAGGVATACKYKTTFWFVTGTGLTLLIEQHSILDAANDANFDMREVA
jgi:hypothetical protein